MIPVFRLEKEYTTIKTKEMEEQVEIKVSGGAVAYVFSLAVVQCALIVITSVQLHLITITALSLSQVHCT